MKAFCPFLKISSLFLEHNKDFVCSLVGFTWDGFVCSLVGLIWDGFVCSLVGLIWDFWGTKWGLYHVTLTLEGKIFQLSHLTIAWQSFKSTFQVLHCFGLNYFHVKYKPSLQFSHVPFLNCFGVELLGNANCRLGSKVHHCPHLKLGFTCSWKFRWFKIMGTKLLDFVTTLSVCVPIVGSINWWWVHPKVLFIIIIIIIIILVWQWAIFIGPSQTLESLPIEVCTYKIQV